MVLVGTAAAIVCSTITEVITGCGFIEFPSVATLPSIGHMKLDTTGKV
jgi:hypothetical protein